MRLMLQVGGRGSQRMAKSTPLSTGECKSDSQCQQSLCVPFFRSSVTQMRQATEYLVATHMKEAMPHGGLCAEGYSTGPSMMRD